MPRWMRQQEDQRHRVRTSSVRGRPGLDDTAGGGDAAGFRIAHDYAPALVDAPVRRDPRADQAAVRAQARAILAGVGPGGRPTPPAAAATLADVLANALAVHGYRL
jgi:hypothetical protein